MTSRDEQTDESIYTHVKRESWKTSVERKPKVMGGRIRKQETVPWKRQAERMQGSHAGSIHLAGGPEETAAQARPVKQERGGGGRRGQEKGSEGLKEEEEAGTKLTLRPCRMHKAKTRQETTK